MGGVIERRTCFSGIIYCIFTGVSTFYDTTNLGEEHQWRILSYCFNKCIISLREFAAFNWARSGGHVSKNRFCEETGSRRWYIFPVAIYRYLESISKLLLSPSASLGAFQPLI